MGVNHFCVRICIKLSINLTSFGIATGIESNGLLLEEDFLNRLSKESKETVSFAISLDGGSSSFHNMIRGNGTFGKTLKKF